MAEIQKRISEEFGIDMTYLDVRILVADLPQPVEPEPPKAPEILDDPNAPGDSGGLEASDELGDSGVAEKPELPESPENPAEPQLAELSVSVDPLAPPGAIACGSVVFSDGTAGKWVLDQMGRLGLSGLPEGYRPPPEDGAQFQTKLVAALRAKGLA